MPDYNDLPEKAEAAIVAVIIAAQTGVPDDQVFGSFTDDAKTKGESSIHVESHGGTEDGVGSGNERLTFAVKLKSNADRRQDDSTEAEEETGTPLARHRLRAAKVFDVLKQSSTALAQQLSDAVPDFYVFDSIEVRRGPSRIENRKFVSEMTIELSCAPSDLS